MTEKCAEIENRNKTQFKSNSKTCSSRATNTCLFCFGFIFGLLFCLFVLSFLQYLTQYKSGAKTGKSLVISGDFSGQLGSFESNISANNSEKTKSQTIVKNLTIISTDLKSSEKPLNISLTTETFDSELSSTTDSTQITSTTETPQTTVSSTSWTTLTTDLNDTQTTVTSHTTQSVIKRTTRTTPTTVETTPMSTTSTTTATTPTGTTTATTPTGTTTATTPMSTTSTTTALKSSVTTEFVIESVDNKSAIDLCPKETHFTCTEGMCVERRRRCDGNQDCVHVKDVKAVSLLSSDESDCYENKCFENFFCDQKCISSDFLCNKVFDCNDLTDEKVNCSQSECAHNQVRCHDGSACIEAKQVCDDTFDCWDHSDEKQCMTADACVQRGRHYCSDGLCVALSLRCDQTTDCSDDELDCRDNGCHDDHHFQCLTHRECVRADQRCDDVMDCTDASDEFDCLRTDSQNVFQVFNNVLNTWTLLCPPSPHLSQSEADTLCRHLGRFTANNWTLVSVKALNTTTDDDRQTNGSLSWTSWTSPFSHTKDLIRNKTEFCETNAALQLFCDAFKCGPNSRTTVNDGTQESNTSVVANDRISEDVPKGYQIFDPKTRHECHAQRIDQQWLVASAQCVEKMAEKFWENFEINSLEENSSEKKLGIKRVEKNPRFSNRFRNLFFSENDLILIELKSLLFSNLNTVCLPQHQLDPEITCFLPQNNKTDVLFEVLDRQKCEKSYKFVNSSHFCAKEIPKPSFAPKVSEKPCLGEKSLICFSSDNFWYISGFVSFEYKCSEIGFNFERKNPSIFSNIFAMKGFLENVLKLNQIFVKNSEKFYEIMIESNDRTTDSGIYSEMTSENDTKID